MTEITPKKDKPPQGWGKWLGIRGTLVVALLAGAYGVDKLAGHPVVGWVGSKLFPRNEGDVQKGAREVSEELTAGMPDDEKKNIAKHNLNNLVIGIEGHIKIRAYPPSQLHTAVKTAKDFWGHMQQNPAYMEEFTKERLSPEQLMGNQGLTKLLEEKYGITKPLREYPGQRGAGVREEDLIWKKLGVSNPQAPAPAAAQPGVKEKAQPPEQPQPENKQQPKEEKMGMNAAPRVDYTARILDSRVEEKVRKL